MNYCKIYQNLIDRSKNRTLDVNEYYESHHIIPRCLGGNDSTDNLTNLTAREHFVAHLCLVRIYPGNHSLVKAAVMMACGSRNHQRSGNRIYEWLRKQHSVAMSISQSGNGNSQFGKVWVFNLRQQENKKIKSLELPIYLSNGWEKGRIYDFSYTHYTCEVCQTKFRSPLKKKTCSNNCLVTLKGKFKPFAGREEEFKTYYTQTKSMNKALKLMGFPGAVSHYYEWAKSLQ
jgi:hypothetical protein